MEAFTTLIRDINYVLSGSETSSTPLLIAGGIVVGTGMLVTMCFFALKPLQPLFKASRNNQPPAQTIKGLREAQIKRHTSARQMARTGVPLGGPRSRAFPMAGKPTVSDSDDPGSKEDDPGDSADTGRAETLKLFAKTKDAGRQRARQPVRAAKIERREAPAEQCTHHAPRPNTAPVPNTASVPNTVSVPNTASVPN
ncbi:MAG: hypothetical protein AAGB03_11000, partial [Pseudomonadota bacterium]